MIHQSHQTFDSLTGHTPQYTDYSPFKAFPAVQLRDRLVVVMRFSINVHQTDMRQAALLNEFVGGSVAIKRHRIHGHNLRLCQQILDQEPNGVGCISLVPETLRHRRPHD